MEREILCKSNNHKKAGVAILISDNIAFKTRGSGSVHQEKKTM